MALVTPVVTYNSITIGGNNITLSSNTGRVSFKAPYNRIDIVMTPTNCSLSYYEVRITAADAAYDIGVGQKVYFDTSIPSNRQYSFSIAVNDENFSLGNGVYRISLYAKSDIDDSWDVAYLLFTVDSNQVKTESQEKVQVLTTRAIPN